MERENRYVVLKIEDIEDALDKTEQSMLMNLQLKIQSWRQSWGKEPKSYVVVGEDWPMYEDTWKAIEEWVDG